jgi:hypothetical protein
MATLLVPRNDQQERPSSVPSDQVKTDGLRPSHPTEPPNFDAHGRSYDTDDTRNFGPSYVRGVTLSAMLQMLSLDRKTCMLEVQCEHRLATMTLVNGELVDAEVDNLEGEDAVYAILSWDQPQMTILDGVGLFRHTVDHSISQLILESARLQDERARPEPREIAGRPQSGSTKANGPESDSKQSSDWEWLVETLVISGARKAFVVNAQSDQVLAWADEIAGRDRKDLGEVHDELTPVTRLTGSWSRAIDPAVSELVLRIGDAHVLVHPIGRDGTIIACAFFEGTEPLDLARRAIGAFVR